MVFLLFIHLSLIHLWYGSFLCHNPVPFLVYLFQKNNTNHVMEIIFENSAYNQLLLSTLCKSQEPPITNSRHCSFYSKSFNAIFHRFNESSIFLLLQCTYISIIFTWQENFSPFLILKSIQIAIPSLTISFAFSHLVLVQYQVQHVYVSESLLEYSSTAWV